MTKKNDDHLHRSEQPARRAMAWHPFYKGKIETGIKCAVRDMDDFSVWYSPGVAAPCRAIADDPEQVYEHTGKANTIGVVSDGTRVLGLGDIGPKAGLPVMEGKALLFKYLGGVDAVPLMLDTKAPDELIDMVLKLQPAFGGFNLEDIASPKCFRILDELREKCEVPVWHDDQQGTATVTLAGLINALKVVDKPMNEVKIVFIGTGASNLACSRLIFGWGADPAKALMVDSKGILGTFRDDLEQQADAHPLKWSMCRKTNPDGIQGTAEDALEGADAVIALSRPGPGTLPAEWLRRMAEQAIVFACANPTPEIWPWEAKEAGAAVVATGRSDFPNQVNNSLGFPGIFRGALDVRARTISDEMCFAAAEAMAAFGEDDLTADRILPNMDDWQVFAEEAAAVGLCAIEQGLARQPLSREQLLESARCQIEHSRKTTQLKMREGLIAQPPNVE